MMNHYDIAYAVGAGLASPLWLLRPAARRKVFSALKDRMGDVPARAGDAPALMIHAVSLGEINATRQLIPRLRAARPGLEFIVTTTTDTGLARGQELYGKESGVNVVRFPLDFSWAVTRLLDNTRPSAVALMELEVWPNFLRQCAKRDLPVVLMNGRLTEASFSRYRLAKPLVRPMFRQLRAICAQDEKYAERFRKLGADPARVSVTGTMKFDTAQVADAVPGAAELAAAVGLSAGQKRIWVCGSTGPGEEQLLLAEYRKLLAQFRDLRLVLVPRKPERFDEVARIITAAGFDCLRRSAPRLSPSPCTQGEGRGGSSSAPPVILGDTMGELRAWYSLAEIVFVGRTLLDLGPRQHGSDMIEPAALAKPTIVGPFTGNFAEPMAAFLAAHAITVINNPAALGYSVHEFLADPAQAAAMGRRAREVVLREHGATDRHVKAILELI